MKARILIVDDERNIRASLKLILNGEGFEIREAASAEDALVQLEGEEFHAAFFDVKLPGIDGIELLARLRKQGNLLPVVMISGHATVERAVEATRLGAFDFVEKPFSRDRIVVAARNATEKARLQEENRRLRGGEDEILGKSDAIGAVRETIAKVAPTDARVLILGESGTGKELVAKALHEQSPRAGRAFVRVNCAAIPEELIEAELFGAEKGAYTGAQARREGRFAAADGGTIFLDEIGDMSLRAQVKVLRVLQEGEFEPVGSSKTHSVDVRVLAATHQDLAALVEAGRFREDLLFRLNVIPLQLPALRERADDIELLVNAFVDHYAAAHELARPGIDGAAMKLLSAYSWPGNIRELKNLMERLVILANGQPIAAASLPSELRADVVDSGSPAAKSQPYADLPLREAKEKLERDLIEAALRQHDGNVTQAAKSLGLERTHLHKRLKTLGLK